MRVKGSSSQRARSVGKLSKSWGPYTATPRDVRADRGPGPAEGVRAPILPGVTSAAVNSPDPAPAPAASSAADDATPASDEDAVPREETARPTARVDRVIPDAPDPRSRYR